ncbi:MAG: hypothetical protein ACEPOZ_07405 [Marinifilaceae bacterium]
MAQINVTMDFICTSEEGYSEKSQNFNKKAPGYVECGVLPQAETEDVINGLTKVEELRIRKNEAQLAAKNLRSEYVEFKEVMDRKLRTYKKVVDTIPLATNTVKMDLGLMNETRTENTNYKKPDLKGKLVAGTPHITFTKKPMQGIKLYCRTNEGEYDFETTVLGSSFNDTRPRLNPKVTEVREYYAYYLYSGIKVGRKSEVIRIVLDPIE